jgi:hypothetical protein
MAMAVLTLLVVASAPAFPWQEEEGEAAEQPPAEGLPDDSTVETILRQQEQLLSGQRFSYDPGGRRDPFRNLFESMRLGPGDKRPRGVAGMLVSEVDLVGIVKDGRADIALLMGSDNKGYFLQVGDAVFDGTVIAVDPRLGTVTFRQEVDDPRRIKPYRDVVKRLVPLDDEESSDE